jgi:hypothetical protein
MNVRNFLSELVKEMNEKNAWKGMRRTIPVWMVNDVRKLKKDINVMHTLAVISKISNTTANGPFSVSVNRECHWISEKLCAVLMHLELRNDKVRAIMAA